MARGHVGLFHSSGPTFLLPLALLVATAVGCGPPDQAPSQVPPMIDKCAQGDATWCELLGDAYMHARWDSMSRNWGAKVDVAEARKAYLRACSLDANRCKRVLELHLLDGDRALFEETCRRSKLPPTPGASLVTRLDADAQRAMEFDHDTAEIYKVESASVILGSLAEGAAQAKGAVPNKGVKQALDTAAKTTGAAAKVAEALEEPAAGGDPRFKGLARLAAGDTGPTGDPQGRNLARLAPHLLVVKDTVQCPAPPAPPPPKLTCPASVAACRDACDQGDAKACARASYETTLSEAERFDFAVKACESKAAVDPADAMMVEAACVRALDTKLLEGHAELRDRAGALVDAVCADTPPTRRCAWVTALAGHNDWFRARPVAQRLVSALDTGCDAMGADACATIAGGFVRADGDSRLEAGVRANVRAALRPHCDAGRAKACTALGAGWAGLDPKGTAAQAADLARACDLDVKECTLAVICSTSSKCKGVGPDPALARRAYRRLCDDYSATVKDPAKVASFSACIKAQ